MAGYISYGLKMLQNTPLGPEDIRLVVTAYEHCLRDLSLKDRDDLLTHSSSLRK